MIACVLHAEPFEGRVTMTISTPSSKDGPQSFTLSLKDGNMRTDIATARSSMSAIMDAKNQQMIILMPQYQKYMVQPFGQTKAPSGTYPGAGAPPSAPSARGSSLQDTGVKETILGYVCTKYIVTGASGESAQIWVTDQLGAFAGLFHGGGPGRPQQAPQAWETALKGQAFFPMRVVSTSSRGTTKMEVTAVEKASLPDSLFAPPEGWTPFSVGGMMGGGFPGMRPPSGNN